VNLTLISTGTPAETAALSPAENNLPSSSATISADPDDQNAPIILATPAADQQQSQG
jgi:hypothetical protein